MMCDELVTAKLKDKHDSEKVEKFYENFADNMAAYREKDELTVETLYGIIEFSKFKETILRFKKDNVQFDRKPEDSPDLRGSAITTEDGYALYEKLAAENVDDPQFKWQKKLTNLTKPGVVINYWQKPMENKALNMTKCHVVMKDVQLS